MVDLLNKGESVMILGRLKGLEFVEWCSREERVIYRKNFGNL